MQRRARLQSTLVGAFMVMAATFSSAAHADWHGYHGTSTGGNYYESPYSNWFSGGHLWSYLWNGTHWASAIQLRYPSTAWTSVYGNDDGTDYGVASCGGYAVAGIYGREGQYVRALGLICGDGTHLPEAGTEDTLYGEYFEDTCAPNEYVTQIRGRAGSWMDQIAIRCEQYIR